MQFIYILVQDLVGLSNSIVLATGLYFREQSSILYIIVTAGGAVKGSYSATGKVARVCLFSYNKTAGVSQLQ